MSAIAGIYATDGRPVERGDLEHMLEVLAHRGTDGCGCWHSGGIGLAHRMFWTTLESLHESLPFVDRLAGLAITADARLDNRAELSAALGVSSATRDSLSDSELILAAYARWGQHCVAHFLGDFVFAIWDSHQQQLFCARDHFGVKPFYYFEGEHAFYFASEIKALRCLEAIPSVLNESRIADYLVRLYDDERSTFYQGIYRLPPAHTLVVSRQQVVLQRYWALDATRELRLKSTAEYAEVFRATFAEAVQCRLRSAFPLGSTLSGGMDSSSVTCMARKLLAEEGQERRLHTFSGTFASMPDCDEQQYMREVIDQGGVEAHLVPIDRLSPFKGYQNGQAYVDQPYFNPAAYAQWTLACAARDQGVHVLLGGFGGDFVVSHGIAYLPELARRGRWRRFMQEGRALAERHHGKLSAIIRKYGLRPLIPEVFKALRRRFRGVDETAHLLADSPISPACAARTHVIERLQIDHRANLAARTSRAAHLQGVSTGLNSMVFETCNTISHVCGIEERYPFFDRRVVELCLALPAELKLHQGWTRYILHRAMEGILPPAIQWRPNKADLSPYFDQEIVRTDRQQLEDLYAESEIMLAPYVELPALRTVSMSSMQFWVAITLAAWLQQQYSVQPSTVETRLLETS